MWLHRGHLPRQVGLQNLQPLPRASKVESSSRDGLRSADERCKENLVDSVAPKVWSEFLALMELPIETGRWIPIRDLEARAEMTRLIEQTRGQTGDQVEILPLDGLEYRQKSPLVREAI